MFWNFKENVTKFLVEGEIFELKQTKNYFIPRHLLAQWVDAVEICLVNGMEIVSFDSRAEFDSVAKMCKQYTNYLNGQTHVGAVVFEAKSLVEWYWVNSGKRVSFPLPFAPNEPNCDGGNELCLSLSRDQNHDFAFNDINCSGSDYTKFICQQQQNPF